MTSKRIWLAAIGAITAIAGAVGAYYKYGKPADDRELLVRVSRIPSGDLPGARVVLQSSAGGREALTDSLGVARFKIASKETDLEVRASHSGYHDRPIHCQNELPCQIIMESNGEAETSPDKGGSQIAASPGRRGENRKPSDDRAAIQQSQSPEKRNSLRGMWIIVTRGNPSEALVHDGTMSFSQTPSEAFLFTGSFGLKQERIEISGDATLSGETVMVSFADKTRSGTTWEGRGAFQFVDAELRGSIDVPGEPKQVAVTLKRP